MVLQRWIDRARFMTACSFTIHPAGEVDSLSSPSTCLPERLENTPTLPTDNESKLHQ